MDREEDEKRCRLKSLEDCIYGEGFGIPEDLEKRAEAYDRNKLNVAKATGYHPQDISVYTNLFYYMQLVLEALIRMPSSGKGSLIGKDELKKFLKEGVKRREISSEDKEVIKRKYIEYKGCSYRKSNRTISAHSQLIKFFLNDKFLELYERSFGEKKN